MSDRPSRAAGAERAIAACLWGGAVVLRVHNAVRFPLDGTADARLGHLDYVRWIGTHWRQPPAALNWETWQPPLYYWVSAVAWRVAGCWSARPDDLFAAPQALVLALLPTACGLIAAWLALRTVRSVVPDDPLARLVTLALVLFIPMHVMLAPWVRNDLLTVLLVSVVAWRLTTAPDLGTLPPRTAVLLGLVVGLALLTKYTGSGALVALVASLGLAATAAPQPRATLGGLVGAVVIAALVAGWFYADHWIRFGRAFVTPADWLGGFQQPPGVRGVGDFLRFPPAVFVRPWVQDPAVIHSLWAGTYATAWFDGHYIFLSHYLARPTAEWLGRVLLILGVVPTLALLAGATVAAVETARGRRLLPWGPLLVLAGWTLVGYVYLNAEAPYYSAVKAHYLLPALVPGAAFVALAVARAPRWARVLVGVDVAAVVVVSGVTFCFGLVG